MKRLLLLILSVVPFLSHGQIITSGTYDVMNVMAYNPQTGMLTGYYQNGTGNDSNGHNLFTCIFYLEGKLINGKASVKTYYPLDIFPADSTDLINGRVVVNSSNGFTIQLVEEHGGCWNVEHFKDEPLLSKLIKQQNWLEIRFVKASKTFFYNAKNEATKRKGFLLKGDIIRVDEIDGEWLHCSYDNHRVQTQGWIKTADTNTPGK